MCRSESRLFRCPGAGCGIRTNPHPPGSASPPRERRPGLATHGLWEEGRGWEGKRGKDIKTRTQADRQSQQMQEEGFTTHSKAFQRDKGHSQSHSFYASRQNPTLFTSNVCNWPHNQDLWKWGEVADKICSKENENEQPEALGWSARTQFKWRLEWSQIKTVSCN